MLKIGKLLVTCSVFMGCAFAYSGDIATMELRLDTPLNSYKTVMGSTFRTVLIAPCTIGDRVLLPAGTVVYGNVKHRTQVSVGLLHERAGLDLEFSEYQLPDGRRFPLRARLRNIENAREAVGKRGHIQGVVAADNPQHWLDGVWKRPSMLLFQHSLLGLTGMSGRVFTGLEMGPWGAAGLIALRVAMFSLPEPEIRLPVGTEMKVVLTALPKGAPVFTLPPAADLPDDVLDWAAEQPFLINKPNGRDSEDLINMGFAATREQLVQAFQAAGWTEAAPRSMHSFSHVWQAYAGQTGYADAPASVLWYRGEEPDFVFQKSFNTIAMRHHIRVWHSDFAGTEIWLGAATHDVAIRFDKSSMSFTHKIDRNIDLERGKLANDLTFAGCTDASDLVARPQVARHGPNPNGVVSDGRIALLSLQSCTAPEAATDLESFKPARSVYIRTARRVILETRQYLVRENPYYWAYRLAQWKRASGRDTAPVEY